MADNFNLRKFLTENKLTKNAKLLKEVVEVDGKEVDIDSMEIDGIDMNDFPDFVDAYVVAASFTDGTDLTDDQLEILSTQHSDIIQDRIHDRQLYREGKKQASSGDMAYTEKAEEGVSEANYSDSYNTPAAKAVNAKANQIVKTIKGYKTALQTIQDAIRQVEQEVGSEATRSERNTLENHLMWMFRREMEMERESVDNKKPVMENLTAKERRLVEMVQDALGITPQAVAEEAPVEEEAPIAEDEMVQENPLPKYKNIDELMANIEHGTNEAAHKYKMGRMKEIADALEAKVTSLEEGENAEHIDQKAVKSMKKDIMTLRKGVDKLEKEFEKKFANKKEKKEDK